MNTTKQTKVKQLKNTWLVQRLNKPYKDPNSLIESFSFGGGLRNGGLSKDAMKLLRPIFSFDYMGSAEFEFGAIPEFFHHIATNIKKYSTFSIKINGVSVFVIGKTEFKDEIIDRVRLLSKSDYRLKESTHFGWALGLDKWFKDRECRTIGWLELDNEFMFFTDVMAFDNTAMLFGLPAIAEHR